MFGSVIGRELLEGEGCSVGVVRGRDRRGGGFRRREAEMNWRDKEEHDA